MLIQTFVALLQSKEYFHLSSIHKTYLSYCASVRVVQILQAEHFRHQISYSHKNIAQCPPFSLKRLCYSHPFSITVNSWMPHNKYWSKKVAFSSPHTNRDNGAILCVTNPPSLPRLVENCKILRGSVRGRLFVFIKRLASSVLKWILPFPSCLHRTGTEASKKFWNKRIRFRITSSYFDCKRFVERLKQESSRDYILRWLAWLGNGFRGFPHTCHHAGPPEDK